MNLSNESLSDLTYLVDYNLITMEEMQEELTRRRVAKLGWWRRLWLIIFST
jgi:hypothetical protein